MPKTDPNVKNDILRKGVVITGSDGYRVALSMGEIMRPSAASKFSSLTQDGRPLPQNSGFRPDHRAGGQGRRA